MPRTLDSTHSQSTATPPGAGALYQNGRSPRDLRKRVRANLRGHLRNSALRLAVLLSVDLVAIALGRALLRTVRTGTFGHGLAVLVGGFLPDAAIAGPALATAVIVGLFASGCYGSGDLWREPARILAAVGIGVMLALYGDLWAGQPGLVLRRAFVIWGSLGLTLVAYRNGVYMLAQRVPRPVMVQRVLEIHGPEEALAAQELGSRYRVLATLSVDALPDDIEAMDDWLDGGVDTILVSGEVPSARFGQITDFALSHGCHLLTVPRSRELVGVDPKRIWVNGKPLFELTAPSLRASQLVLKRILDVFGSSVLIALFSPVMLLVALAVKIDSPGPVLFRHRRAGLRGRFFGLLKFRSMRADAEQRLLADSALYSRYVENNFKLSEDEDPRITRLGRFLRRSSLDELPQLFNVLKGDMSLVGPRPVVEPELEMYRGRIPTFLSVKPGVTGLWQISGRSDVGFPERAEMDLKYVRDWSLLKDMWILFMTVPAVLLSRGAH